MSEAWIKALSFAALPGAVKVRFERLTRRPRTERLPSAEFAALRIRCPNLDHRSAMIVTMICLKAAISTAGKVK